MSDIKSIVWGLFFVLAMVAWISHGCRKRMERFQEFRQERQEQRQERWDERRDDRSDRWQRWRGRRHETSDLDDPDSSSVGHVPPVHGNSVAALLVESEDDDVVSQTPQIHVPAKAPALGLADRINEIGSQSRQG